MNLRSRVTPENKNDPGENSAFNSYLPMHISKQSYRGLELSGPLYKTQTLEFNILT